MILYLHVYVYLYYVGMPSPHGYRTALRLMQLAEKFHLPVVSTYSLSSVPEATVNII